MLVKYELNAYAIIFGMATDDVSRAAAAMGRKGGKAKVPKGFSSMDPEARADAGRKGAQKRWGKKAAKKKAK